MEPVASLSITSPWLLVAAGLALIFWPQLQGAWRWLTTSTPSQPTLKPTPVPPIAPVPVKPSTEPPVIDRQFAFRFLDELDRHFEVAGNKEGRAAIQAAGRALFSSPLPDQVITKYSQPVTRVRG